MTVRLTRKTEKYDVLEQSSLLFVISVTEELSIVFKLFLFVFVFLFVCLFVFLANSCFQVISHFRRRDYRLNSHTC